MERANRLVTSGASASAERPPRACRDWKRWVKDKLESGEEVTEDELEEKLREIEEEYRRQLEGSRETDMDYDVWELGKAAREEAREQLRKNKLQEEADRLKNALETATIAGAAVIAAKKAFKAIETAAGSAANFLGKTGSAAGSLFFMVIPPGMFDDYLPRDPGSNPGA